MHRHELAGRQSLVRPTLVVHIPCMKVTRTHSQGSLTDADTSLCMCRQEVELGRTRPGQEGRSRGDERVHMELEGGWPVTGGQLRWVDAARANTAP